MADQDRFQAIMRKALADGDYFVTAEECAEQFGCTAAEWNEAVDLKLVPEPYVINGQWHWRVGSLWAWEAGGFREIYGEYVAQIRDVERRATWAKKLPAAENGGTQV